jgi:hypothetical protein
LIKNLRFNEIYLIKTAIKRAIKTAIEKIEDMSIVKVCLPISQLAILIGLSKYGSLSQIILDLWIKIDLEGYSQRLCELEKKHNKSFRMLSEKDKLEILSKELGINDLMKKTIQTMKNDSKEKFINDQNIILQEIEQRSQVQVQNNLNKEEIEIKKKTLNKLVNNFTNRGYGNHHENSVITIYSQLTNSNIIDQQKVLIALFATSDTTSNSQSPAKTIEWYLKGKIDGIAIQNSPNTSINANNNQILIEIKNRTKSLFGHLKEYEKPQIQAYLKLINLQNGHLVEHLKDSSSVNSTNIIEVPFEKDYWKMIKKRLNRFIDFFINFLSDLKMQELIILDGQYDDSVDQYLRGVLETYF